MRRILRIGFLLPFASLAVCAQPVVLRVTNPLRLDRPAEMVVVRWSDIVAKVLKFDPQTIEVREQGSGAARTSQVIDLDGDGTMEELLFQSDFKAGETKTFVVSTPASAGEAAKSLTDARFVEPREDIAWENDRIAYRMYGPALAKEVNNGIDVWTKRVRYLIVEKWYKASEGDSSGKGSYHEDHGEGGDFFNVGRSLGAGSCALWWRDSLYQPGVFAGYRIIAAGPLRAVFELTYSPVLYMGRGVREVKRITLDAGKNLNRVEVTYASDGENPPATFAAGIVKRSGTTTYSDKKGGWVSLWGLTTEKEESGYLGTGVVMPASILRGIKEDKTHVLMLGTAKLGSTVAYYAGAGWTRSGDFGSVGEWNKYLSEFALKAQTPLRVRVVAK